jgi:hypothetical protein
MNCAARRKGHKFFGLSRILTLVRRLPAVFRVRYVLFPADGVTIRVGILDGNVCHERIRPGAVPVAFFWLEPYRVAGSGTLDGAIGSPDQRDPRDNEQALTEGMSMPGGPGPRLECHPGDAHPRRGFGLDDGVEKDNARKPRLRASLGCS